MPGQFLSPEGDLENYFVTEYWLIDQYIGDELWTWGFGSEGVLGNAVTTNVSTPTTTFAGGTNWKQVSCSESSNYSGAIKTDGTLWIWGGTSSGRLGNGVTAFTSVSTPVTTFSGGTNWKQISIGSGSAAAIKTDGTLWTWGFGGNGRLGTNDATDRSTPVTTFAGGTNWKQVSVRNQVVAIKTDGTLWTWGYGGSGILGTNDVISRSTPVTTFAGGTNWKQVDCGTNNTAAIKTDGTLWTWGYGGSGRLGTNDVISRSTPVTTFAGGINWKQVSFGINHGMAIKTDGTLWGWGLVGSGQLGELALSNKFTPVTTFAGGTNWKQVSAGNAFSAAIKTDGTLWIWGGTSSGRLGNAVIIGNISTPITTFAGGTNWKQVSAGYRHTAAVQAGINAEYPLS